MKYKIMILFLAGFLLASRGFGQKIGPYFISFFGLSGGQVNRHEFLDMVNKLDSRQIALDIPDNREFIRSFTLRFMPVGRVQSLQTFNIFYNRVDRDILDKMKMYAQKGDMIVVSDVITRTGRVYPGLTIVLM